MGTSYYDIHALYLYIPRHSHLDAKRRARTYSTAAAAIRTQYKFARSRRRSSRATYMKFSKTVGNSWHNVLDQLQPGVPGGAIKGRHGRDELHTSAAAASTTGYDKLYIMYYIRIIINYKL